MPYKIVITGGPSAGKTTLLGRIETRFQSHTALVPEAASLLFSSGHPRPTNSVEAFQTQKRIYSLQRELEIKAEQMQRPSIFCDRGSLDGSAYWPGSLHEFCLAMDTSVERELTRYTVVIHLQTAEEGRGYTNTQLRTETHAEAAFLDSKIAENWGKHPNYIFIPNQSTFEEKLEMAIYHLRPYLPVAQATAVEQSFNSLSFVAF